ncbi:hypothetical protein HDU92_004339 [Lobulomyces angularis]|nr:hypothetical protein HDU92_004339 [Lobulomyces angularis]
MSSSSNYFDLPPPQYTDFDENSDLNPSSTLILHSYQHSLRCPLITHDSIKKLFKDYLIANSSRLFPPDLSKIENSFKLDLIEPIIAFQSTIHSLIEERKINIVREPNDKNVKRNNKVEFNSNNNQNVIVNNYSDAKDYDPFELVKVKNYEFFDKFLAKFGQDVNWKEGKASVDLVETTNRNECETCCGTGKVPCKRCQFQKDDKLNTCASCSNSKKTLCEDCRGCGFVKRYLNLKISRYLKSTSQVILKKKLLGPDEIFETIINVDNKNVISQEKIEKELKHLIFEQSNEGLQILPKLQQGGSDVNLTDVIQSLDELVLKNAKLFSKIKNFRIMRQKIIIEQLNMFEISCSIVLDSSEKNNVKTFGLYVLHDETSNSLKLIDHYGYTNSLLSRFGSRLASMCSFFSM